MAVIEKGPSHFAANLGLGKEHFKFCPSNQTFSPTWKGLKVHQFLAFIVWWVLHMLCPHGILFPFPLCATLCRFPPDRLRCTVQARLCHKRCSHVIGLGPYHLSMMSYPMP